MRKEKIWGQKDNFLVKLLKYEAKENKNLYKFLLIIVYIIIFFKTTITSELLTTITTLLRDEWIFVCLCIMLCVSITIVCGWMGGSDWLFGWVIECNKRINK